MKNRKYKVKFENLALPEIFTKKHKQPKDDERSRLKIAFEHLALPEVHIKKIKYASKIKSGKK